MLIDAKSDIIVVDMNGMAASVVSMEIAEDGQIIYYIDSDHYIKRVQTKTTERIRDGRD